MAKGLFLGRKKANIALVSALEIKRSSGLVRGKNDKVILSGLQIMLIKTGRCSGYGIPGEKF